jgi:hypothetical protein
MRRTDFARVEAIARTLPGVEVTTTWGKPALKVRGRLFACVPSHKSAEPHSLVVIMDVDERDLLLEEAPDVYYLKEHYVAYPCVLVRLSRVTDAALRDLVVGAHRFVSARARMPRRAPRPSARGEGTSR